MPDPGGNLGAAPARDAGAELSDLAVVALTFARDAILVLHGGRPLWVTPSVTELLGWRPDELLALTAAELVHPDDLAAVRGIQGLLDQGLPVSGRARLRHKDGSWVWIESHMRPVYDVDGSYGKYNVSTMVIFLLGVASTIPFMDMSFYHSYFAKMIGSDVAWIPALIVPASLYVGYARLKANRSATAIRQPV